MIMEKVSRPKGLIRYVSEAELEGDKTRWVRPRPITYALLLLGVLAIFGSLLFVRTPLALDVVREAKDGAFGRTADQRVSNRYNVRLINKQSPSRTVKLSIEGLDGAELVSPVNPVVLPAEESKVVQVFVLLSPEATKKPVSRFDFLAVDTTDANIVQRSETTFIRGSVRP